MLSFDENRGPQIPALVRLPQDPGTMAADLDLKNALKTGQKRPAILLLNVRRFGQSHAPLYAFQYAFQQRHLASGYQDHLKHIPAHVPDPVLSLVLI